jgi:hypothetical protein
MGRTDVTDIGLVEALNACESQHEPGQDEAGTAWWQKLLLLLAILAAVSAGVAGICYLTAWMTLHILFGGW